MSQNLIQVRDAQLPSQLLHRRKVAPDPWSAVAAIAGAISACAAFAALCFAASQYAQAVSATSFSSVQKFSDDCRSLFKECHECAQDPVKFERCLTDILGSFELFSIAVNEGGLTDRTRIFIIETIAEYLDKMSEAGYHDYVVEMTEKPSNCRELKNLFVQHRRKFSSPQNVAEMLNVRSSSL